MKTVLRAFNEQGINGFRDLITEMRTDGVYRDPSHLMFDEKLTTVATLSEVDLPSEFSTRRECGEFFVQLFSSMRSELVAARIDPDSNAGLWTWLSAALLPFLSAQGTKVGEEARLIFKPHVYDRFYRHLLAGPYLICSKHRDDLDVANIVLFNSVIKPFNDFVEQIASRTQIIYHKETMRLLTKMYMDPSTRKPRSTKVPIGMPKTTGSIKRFGVVFNQLALVWDVFELTMEEIELLLPREFRWLLD